MDCYQCVRCTPVSFGGYLSCLVGSEKEAKIQKVSWGVCAFVCLFVCSFIHSFIHLIFFNPFVLSSVRFLPCLRVCLFCVVVCLFAFIALASHHSSRVFLRFLGFFPLLEPSREENISKFQFDP